MTPEQILLFPTVIHEYDLPNDHTVTQLKKVIDATPLKQHGKVAASSYSGRDKGILADPRVKDLADRLQECVDGWASAMGCDELMITNSWVNNLGRGDRIEYHRHELSVCSGVFYVDVEPGSVGLDLHSPLEQLRMFEHSRTPNFYNANFITTECVTGRLLLFPSWLSHSSRNNETDRRVSLAFNTIYRHTVNKIFD
jgi:uncharacterized protein (TIGR02466 family)